jgi:hypothetical protein
MPRLLVDSSNIRITITQAAVRSFVALSIFLSTTNFASAALEPVAGTESAALDSVPGNKSATDTSPMGQLPDKQSQTKSKPKSIISKKRKSKDKTTPSQDNPNNLATVLPAFKGPRRLVVNFETQSEGTTVPNGSVTASLQKSLNETADARAALNSSLEKDNLATNSNSNSSSKITSNTVILKTPSKIQALPSDQPQTIHKSLLESVPLVAPITLAPKMTPPDIPAQIKTLPAPATVSLASAVEAQLSTAPANSVNTATVTESPTDAESSSASQSLSANQSIAAPHSLPAPQDATSAVSLRSPHQIYLSVAKLNAPYKGFDSKLKNCATSYSVGLGKKIDLDFEARLSLSVFQSSDQSLAPMNLRMISTRADILHFFQLPSDLVNLSQTNFVPFISFGLGHSTYNVSKSNIDTGSKQLFTGKQYANGGAITAIPGLGGRFILASDIQILLSVEYFGLLAVKGANYLSGLNTAITVGFNF